MSAIMINALNSKGFVALSDNGYILTDRGRDALAPSSTLTDLELNLLEEFGEENGSPSGLVAQNLGISTAAVTKAANQLAERGLLEDTGYAMKFNRKTNWQFIDRPKTEGGMISKPGASTVWRTTRAGIEALTASGRNRMGYRLEPGAFWD